MHLYIEIVQMSGTVEKGDYFWVLKDGKVQLARSRKIELKSIIEPEATEVAKLLGLTVIVNERS